nr:CatB-related O-acetyltransferase [uncultured Treponema sp.]
MKKLVKKIISKLNAIKLITFECEDYNRAEEKFRKANGHNFVKLEDKYSDYSKIKVGKNTYGKVRLLDDSKANTKLKIGSYCSIGPDVVFILGSEHKLNTLTTYPLKNKLINGEKEALSKGDIVIGDDVWLGYGATICSGVKIGQGAVIAAGAVVTKDIEPYTIVAGIPAAPLKKRFSEKVIEKLLNVDIVSLLDKINKDNCNLIDEELNDENIDRILAELS